MTPDSAGAEGEATVHVGLVERARAGDHAAFRELIDLETHECYAVAFRIVRDAERAQDAVQEAFLNAWRDLPQLRDVNRFSPWLYRLLVRASYAEARRFRIWTGRTRELAMDPRTSTDFTADVAKREAIDKAFKRLSPEHRAVLVLHHYRGMPLATVADVVQAPIGTVKSRLHHATRALRSALEADSRAGMPEERPA